MMFKLVTGDTCCYKGFEAALFQLEQNWPKSDSFGSFWQMFSSPFPGKFFGTLQNSCIKEMKMGLVVRIQDRRKIASERKILKEKQKEK